MAIEQAHQIPSDFPRGAGSGAVAGHQGKLAVRMVESRFVEGPTDEEHMERFLACQDLVEQLESYCKPKLHENNALDIRSLLPRVRQGVIHKDWDHSPREHNWIMSRVNDLFTKKRPPPQGGRT